ncbi:cupin [Candidatus Peregrinibacteria bacterium]|nr:cupin [Candidatus Peregrinibacteria bacterium]
MIKKSLNKTKKNILLAKVQIKEKPWGREIWFAHTGKYAGKILEVKKGHRYSLQYHEKKQETQYIFQGKVLFTMGSNMKKLQKKILLKGQKVDVTPGCIHRLEAIEDALIFEVSTPELDDVIKIEDDYGRNGKGNNETEDKELHKFLNKISQ